MTSPMPETMSPREKVARTITYNPVYGKLWEGSDPTKGHIYHLASSGDHAELARLAEAVGLVERSIDLMTDEYADTKAYREEVRTFLSKEAERG